jgi:hypothetical protein
MRSRSSTLKTYALLIVIAQVLLALAVVLIASHADSTTAAVEERATPSQPVDHNDARY